MRGQGDGELVIAPPPYFTELHGDSFYYWSRIYIMLCFLTAPRGVRRKKEFDFSSGLQCCNTKGLFCLDKHVYDEETFELMGDITWTN